MKHGMPDRFSAGTSMIHNMDAGVKLICYFLLLLSVLIGCHFAGYAAVTAFAAAAVYLAQIPFSTVLRVLLRLRWLMVVTLMLNSLFYSSGDILFASVFTPSFAGLMHGAVMVLRIALILVFSLVFSATSSPVKVTQALDTLLRPLARVVPAVTALSTVFTLAMRFIPTLFQDAETIRQLQRMRGTVFGKSAYLNQAERIKPVLIPLTIKAFRRADALAMAMEARGYDCSRCYTAAPWHRPNLSEGMAILVCAALCALQAVVI